MEFIEPDMLRWQFRSFNSGERRKRKKHLPVPTRRSKNGLQRLHNHLSPVCPFTGKIGLSFAFTCEKRGY